MAYPFFKALKEKKPDLVILDLMLPDEDGSDYFAPDPR
jgi:Response regulators consisting of a CheY-like receiver domain and a winged-helix DNA-binding domain